MLCSAHVRSWAGDRHDYYPSAPLGAATPSFSAIWTSIWRKTSGERYPFSHHVDVCIHTPHGPWRVLLYSSKVATAPIKALQWEEKVWLCWSSEGGYASRACEEDHTRPWWHDTQKVPEWQACLPWVRLAWLWDDRVQVDLSCTRTFAVLWSTCLMLCWSCWRTCPCLGNRSEMSLYSTTSQGPSPLSTRFPGLQNQFTLLNGGKVACTYMY